MRGDGGAAASVLFAEYGKGPVMNQADRNKLLGRMYPKLWDCIAVSCPSCDAAIGQRCKPLGPPYKVRSTRAEVAVPHTMRLRLHNLKRNRETKCDES